MKKEPGSLMAQEEKESKQETSQTTQQPKAELPPVNFTNFISGLASTAYAYLGGFQDPETKQPIVELELVKHTIDTIDMLKEKTKGNLTAPEKNFLDNMLYDLKMTYVRVSSSPPSSPPPQTEQAEAQSEQKQEET